MKKNSLFDLDFAVLQNKYKDKAVKESHKLIANNLSQCWTISNLQDVKITLNKPLSYIPYDLKDNYVTKNILTTAGCNILSNYIPNYSSTVYQKLKAAGATLMTKSNMDELGQGDDGANQFFGRAKHPLDPKYTTGGSSAGATCLVASGCVAFSIGSDTGDSIRRPAILQGVFGFKPSYGRISRYGLIPYAPSLDTVGIIAKNLNNLILIYSILNGEDPLDLTTIKGKDKVETLSKSKTIKIGVFVELEKLIDNSQYLNKYKRLLKNLQNKTDIKIINLKFDADIFGVLNYIYKIIANAESISCSSNLTGLWFGNKISKSNWQNSIETTRTQNLGTKVRTRFLFGLYATEKKNQEAILKKAKQIRTLVSNYLEETMQNVDGFLSPLCCNGAPIYEDIKRKNVFSQKVNILEDCSLLANLCGLPSIALPISKLDNELPIGVLLTGKYKKDYDLLNISKKIMKINDEI